jgi:hypothetical protein
MTFNQYATHARTLKDADLEIIVSTKVPSSQEAIFAKLELARRERRRTFWLRDIVSWIAPVISIISIVLSLRAGKS